METTTAQFVPNPSAAFIHFTASPPSDQFPYYRWGALEQTGVNLTSDLLMQNTHTHSSRYRMSVN